jgi:hypothetical protein
LLGTKRRAPLGRSFCFGYVGYIAPMIDRSVIAFIALSLTSVGLAMTALFVL